MTLPNDRNLNDLHPALKILAGQFVANCALKGVKTIITQTWRSPAEQDALFAQGRTTPGPIVTNAEASESKHCFILNGEPASKAFDYCILNDNGHIIIDGSHPLYGYAGAIGEALGLSWGGTWPRPKTDYDHFEIA